MRARENPPPRQAMATGTLFLANGLGIGAWAAALPGLQDRLSFNTLQLSVALFSFAVAAVISMSIGGGIAVRLGAARLSVLSAASFGIAFVFVAFSWNVAVLIVSAGFLGSANGLLDVSMNAHATFVERLKGQPMMSSFHAAFSIGGLVGAGVSGLAVQTIGVRWSLLSIVIFIMALTLAALPVLALGDDPTTRTTSPTFSWPNRRTVGLCTLTFICLLVEGAMVDWSAIYLANVADASYAMSAAGYAVFSLSMAAGRLVGDRMVAAVGRPRMIEAGALMAGLGLGVAALVPSATIVVVGFALVGIGLANVIPILFSIAARLETTAALGISKAATSGYAGFVIGPFFIGTLSSYIGLQFSIASLATGAAAIAFIGRWGGASWKTE
jgi:MFS family permease